jgi:hypothetical protein
MEPAPLPKQFQERLAASCQWIRQNWNAENTEVPDDLLLEWTHPKESPDDGPPGFHLAVFTFGYLHHERITKKVSSEQQQSVQASRLLELYYLWQLKLALTSISRVTGVHTSPLPLFHFPENETVHVRWT